jgi:hypothetical protein
MADSNGSGSEAAEVLVLLGRETAKLEAIVEPLAPGPVGKSAAAAGTGALWI